MRPLTPPARIVLKRLSRKQKLRLLRRSRRVERRRTHRSRKRILHTNAIVDYSNIQAPEVFTLGDVEARIELLKFLSKLRNLVVQKGKATRINFSGTRKMIADGTLLFTAELRRILRLSMARVPISCIGPRNQKVAQVLSQIGVFALLRYRGKVRPSLPDVVNWRFATGNGVVGNKYDDVLGAYDGILAESLSQGLYVGLVEAMTNSHHHAYIARRGDGLGIENEPRDWWMFTQERDGNLSVVFCDLGVGIPETLPRTRPSLWQSLTDRLSGRRMSDGTIIYEAILDSRSRTGASYRGRGLRQLVDVIQKVPVGKLMIFSNGGLYTCIGGIEKHFDFKDSILGTLIIWNVPVRPLEA